MTIIKYQGFLTFIQTKTRRTKTPHDGLLLLC